jgi:hypothetical protein
MAQRQHSGSGPAGLELGIDVHWCIQCDADRTVQIMHLTGDPEPVAVCTQCGCGVDMWLASAAADNADHAGQAGRGRALASQRGAA